MKGEQPLPTLSRSAWNVLGTEIPNLDNIGKRNSKENRFCCKRKRGGDWRRSYWGGRRGREYDLGPKLQNLGRGKKPSDAARSALIPKCISGKLLIVGAIVVIAAFTIIIISLAVKKIETCLPCRPLVSVPCLDSWISYNGKCLYVSKEERNWSLSLTTCTSFNASLAVIDTQKELDFWVDIFRSSHYWFGLSRKVNQIWKWSNGTEFKNQLIVSPKSWQALLKLSISC
ncbi:C-type lectin domain family 2 member A-like isoform X2 [Ahaetulla prasina]|uniref:C-type lectin domain family 2 member A-like isoform X2 n=1 Tax=Ahaetulla prasina TaxID=499056 RepID=UPI002648B264|nr:C-type lectin domain family 2 member A-like isoform X2 [Ahaetulla prasina]